MSKWRKKPVEIEAVQFPYREWGDEPLFEELPEWLVAACEDGTIEPVFLSEDYWYLQIVTLEGTMLAGPDDWIIRGIQGELYPCKPDIFAASYEPVD